jgi:NADH:ubiquinone oxidoreductase subunit D/NADH:ubiquinone oxidoreductase subunit C
MVAPQTIDGAALLGEIAGAQHVGVLGPGNIPCVTTGATWLFDLVRTLRDDHGFADLTLLTAEETVADVDGDQEPGVTVIYGLARRADHGHVFVRVPLPESGLCAPSISELWTGAAALEREVFDLFGVVFTGHPGLTRIVLRDDFDGHPLRKGFELHESGVTAEEVASAVASHGDLLPGPESHSPLAELLDAGSSPGDPQLRSERLILNMGPQHPSMHGVLHLWLALDGEQVIAAEPTHGYLHRCIEKLCEARDHRACTALLDRCDYVSGIHTELAHVLALEELAGIESTPKADHLRVIISELVRITSHHTWFAACGLDTGALTPFLYAFIDRELILDFLEEVTGARMMFNYLRPGGVKDDLPVGTAARIVDYLKGFDRAVDEYESLLTDNEIFRMRTRGVGMLSAERVLSGCVTGPMARASGVDIDLRRDEPYAAYGRFDVHVPLGEAGDTFDRYTVRIAEMRESARIALEALEGLPEGAHVTEGIPRVLKPPAGTAFRRVESPRGELGVYLVSDGSSRPWRLKVRSPAFSNLHIAGPLLQGLRVGDVVAVLGSVDVVMGEIDR